MGALSQDGHAADVHAQIAAVLEFVGTESLLTARAGGGFEYTAPWDAVLCWLTEIGRASCRERVFTAV